jgi:hypothetical protein
VLEMLDIPPHVPFFLFNCLHWALEGRMTRSLANNFTALTHASSASVLTGLYVLGNKSVWPVAQSISMGYFLYDLLHIARFGKRNLSDAVYTYHHLACLYILQKDPEVYKVGQILLWGELSNIPMYYVYYLLKTDGEPKLLLRWQYIQAVVYTCIRLPVLGWIGYTLIPRVADKSPFYPLAPLYCMGLYWSSKLWRNLLKR